MAVTHLQIIRITDGHDGATVLHLEDGSISVQSPAWVEKNRPLVGGFLVDDGKPMGEQWFAANSLSTLPAVLVEVQRVAVKPGELVLFKLPPGAPVGSGDRLRDYLSAVVPELNCLVMMSGTGVEVSVISAAPAEGTSA